MKQKAPMETQRRGENRGAESAKEKPQISTDFFCGICGICGFNNPIGVNLCQSVDRDAKDTKGTKDAKKVTQRRRENRGAESTKKGRKCRQEKTFCVLCKFLCPLWFFPSIGVNLCQSVNVFLLGKTAKITQPAHSTSHSAPSPCAQSAQRQQQPSKLQARKAKSPAPKPPRKPD